MTQVGVVPGHGRCAVTGANGYLGSRMVRAMRNRGWIAYELAHRSPARDDSGAGALIPYDLERGIDADRLRNIDVLIHCAYDFRPTAWKEIVAVNVRGSSALFDAAAAAGVGTVIYISTMSAFPGCASLYGRAKLAIETAAEKIGAAIVRPGLVFGRRSGGMVGALEKAVRSQRFVPLVGGGRQTLFLAHEDDLIQLILKLSVARTPSHREPIVAACERGKTLREILAVLAAAHGQAPVFVPVPWPLVWAGLRLSERLGIRLGFRSDSVVSLASYHPSPSFEGMRELGVGFREFTLETLMQDGDTDGR